MNLALVVLLGGLLWLGARTEAAEAQGGIRVLEAPAPEYVFGEHLSLRLAASSTAEIDEIALYIKAGRSEAVALSNVVFVPGKRVEANASVDLALSPLPPFSEVEYWWVVSDRAGESLTTDRSLFYYEDNRFAWQQLSRGILNVHWYEGDEAFAETALETATGALGRANREIRAPLPEQVDIYIYADTRDAQAALRHAGRLWADGHADPALGVVIVAVPPGLSAEFDLAREIPHELTHILLYRALNERYAYLPAWLNEGLAAFNEATPDRSLPPALAAARDARQLLPLESLCGPFAADAEEARLGYAQSESVVRYIHSRFGSEGLHALILAYAEGSSCSAGVEAALGVTLADLEADWLANVIYVDNLAPRWRILAPWLVLSVLVLAGLALFALLTLGAAGPRRS